MQNYYVAKSYLLNGNVEFEGLYYRGLNFIFGPFRGVYLKKLIPKCVVLVSPGCHLGKGLPAPLS